MAIFIDNILTSKWDTFTNWNENQKVKLTTVSVPDLHQAFEMKKGP